MMTNQISIEYKPAIERKRVSCTLTKEIRVPPRKILVLACPVEELRWIPDWEYHLLYSESGVNETGCIFTEEKSGLLLFGKPVTTTWYTALHNPENNRIIFHLTLERKAIISFNFNVKEVAEKISVCTWNMVFTAIDDEANSLEEEEISTKVDTILAFLSQCLKHYCETGQILGS